MLKIVFTKNKVDAINAVSITNVVKKYICSEKAAG